MAKKAGAFKPICLELKLLSGRHAYPFSMLA